MTDLKVITTFTFPHEAHFAQALLEDEDISTMLEDEFTVGVFSGISNALGGVKLLVHNDDLERAKQILIENNIINPDDTLIQD
ncbi:MAG: hypothetical protein A2X64_00360 [Ignavibacteria bacterium GWF2_33_9]|nr:MAG: hypothetical protein A2X64_00360 [Ignavibacteria bacterium GWF2_33_9]